MAKVFSPGLLQPLVEGVGVLSKLLTQLVVLLLPPLLLLQLQLPLLQQENKQRDQRSPEVTKGHEKLLREQLSCTHVAPNYHSHQRATWTHGNVLN